MKLSAQSKIGVGVLAAIMVIGFCAYVFQLTQGLCVTGMSNGVSWGLYITCFMFFVGLSAGGLIVASSAHVFGIESFKRVSMPAVITSTVCILCAGAFILIDLGGIQRIWNMFIHLNFTSPLAWDMCVITTYLVINVLDIIWRRCARPACSIAVASCSRTWRACWPRSSRWMRSSSAASF